MAVRPKNLIYWIDEKPKFFVLLLLSVQHIFLMSSTLVLPVVLVSQIGGSFQQVSSVVALTMISCGIGTITQALRFGILGSGYVCPNLCGPNFFMASMESAWMGGIPLMRGMTIVAGLFEAIFSRFINKLKALFPTEITGFVVLMVAIQLIPIGLSKFTNVSYEGEPVQYNSVLIASITLLSMVCINAWFKGKLKMYSVLIGMIIGYVTSYFFGFLTASDFAQVLHAPIVAIPQYGSIFDITFKWSLVPVFIIISVTGALKSFGNLIMCEKINDAEWQKPNVKRIANGLMADALSVTVSGLIGGVASDTSASNVALCQASGATSRVIGFMSGALFILLAFSPKISGMLTLMPAPVMGAILVFVTCFMIMSGTQIIVESGSNIKCTFVIGMAYIFALGVSISPSIFYSLPYMLKPIFDSPLTLGTVIAVIMNQLLLIGQRR